MKTIKKFFIYLMICLMFAGPVASIVTPSNPTTISVQAKKKAKKKKKNKKKKNKKKKSNKKKSNKKKKVKYIDCDGKVKYRYE